VLPPISSLTASQVAQILNRLPMLEQFGKAVRQHALEQMSKGAEVPGFKLVQAVTHRKWRNDAEIEIDMVVGADAFETKILSVAAVEKIAKAKKLDISHLIVKPAGAPTIAPQSDKRPALTSVKAEDVFENLENGEEV
jgi:hypothetical protein